MVTPKLYQLHRLEIIKLLKLRLRPSKYIAKLKNSFYTHDSQEVTEVFVPKFQKPEE